MCLFVSCLLFCFIAFYSSCPVLNSQEKKGLLKIESYIWTRENMTEEVRKEAKERQIEDDKWAEFFTTAVMWGAIFNGSNLEKGNYDSMKQYNDVQ